MISLQVAGFCSPPAVALAYLEVRGASSWVITLLERQLYPD